jgi:uncharacterized protein YgbK (DUF1537 family)
VLDDDPTGIQTVHACYLLTSWEPERLRMALEDDQRFFYVLTNTRAHNREKARRIVGEIVDNVLAANKTLEHPLVFVSRSDSTLRNHFPVEVDVICHKLETDGAGPVDAVFLVPAFIECGRLTMGDMHYLVEGNRRVPVSETEFARDSVFGYQTSRLPDYVEEKTGGKVPKESVKSIPVEWTRSHRPESTGQSPESTVQDPETNYELNRFLAKLESRAYVVVNAETYDDLNCFAKAVLRQINEGKRFVFQSASSLVKALAEVSDKPLLGKAIVTGNGPGLFVVGSHVVRTSAQLNRLLESSLVEGVELDVSEILRAGEALRLTALERIETIWRQGRAPVVFTSRSELTFESKEERLHAGEIISHFLAGLVRSLPIKPSFLVSKGGITSHDILVRGLEVHQARVLGQILPGVPVLRAPDQSSQPGIPYVIFPGNVGDENSLLRILEILT